MCSPGHTTQDIFLPVIDNDTNSSAGLSNLPSECHLNEESDALHDLFPEYNSLARPSLECPHCHMAFTRSYLLNTHVRTHTGYKPYQCILCGRAFSQRSHVTRHLQSHRVFTLKHSIVDSHTDSGTVEVRLKCAYCGAVFDSGGVINKHMNDSHANDKVFVCPASECGEEFVELKDVMEHLSEHSGQFIYSCVVCRAIFATLQEVGHHQMSHTANERKRPAESSSNVRRLECQCPKCSYISECPRLLRKHMVVHNQPKFRCKSCGMRFIHGSSLHKHRAVHSSPKYKCPHCDVTFSRSDALTRHINATHSRPSLKCPYSPCNAIFSRKDHVKQHISVHDS